MRIFNLLLSLLLLMLLSACATEVVETEQVEHWTYANADSWGDLEADFHMCREGQNQSPIDISGNIDADLPELVFDYYSSPVQTVNNGHTIQQNIEPGSFLRVPSRNTEHQLLQFHFHSPSEHTINGKSYAMEIHFVHANANGGLAVVGVMVKEGRENAELAKLWAWMPQQSGETIKQAVGIEETNLLPPTRDYYYYSGSLTTPPCSEGVAWVVLKKPIEASRTQIEQFKQRMGSVTNRPIQKHNARMILE